MTKTISRVTATFLLALLCSVAVAGTAEPASATTQKVLLKRAVKAYSDAFLDGRGADAYAMLTRRCKARTDRDKFLQISDLAKQMYGGPMAFKTYRAVIDGRRARATYTYEAWALNQRNEPWLKVSGRWRLNQC